MLVQSIFYIRLIIFNLVSLYDKLAIRLNHIYIGYVEYDDKYFLHNGCYYHLKYNDELDENCISMNSLMRGNMGIGKSGTLDILPISNDNIHTKKLRDNNRLLNIDLQEISKLIPNYSGAECAGLVRCALSMALAREMNNLKINSQNIIITQDDFIKSIQEIKPMYGCTNINKVEIDDNIHLLFNDVKRENITCNNYTIDQLTYVASMYKYEYIRVISPQALICVGYTIQAWAQEIYDIFNKTKNVKRSVIIIKDRHNIERGDIHYILNAYLNDMSLPCCKIICI